MKKVPPSSPSVMSDPSNEYKGRILIVDCELGVTASFVPALEEYGFIVDKYDDPLIALSNFRTDLYDLLLVDIRLPIMNGFELYDKIRKMDKRIKVCFMSTGNMNYLALREHYQESEIDCIIQKPIEISKLVGKIKTELK